MSMGNTGKRIRAKLSALFTVGCAAALAQLPLRANFFDYDSFFDGSTGAGKWVDSTHPVNSIFDFRIGGDSTDAEPPGLPFSHLGYDPLSQTVINVELAIQVVSSRTSLQTVQVNLDGLILNTYFSSGLTFGGSLSPIDKAALIAAAQDGQVLYSIAAGDVNSSFNVNFAQLRIVTHPKTVPETGSSLALLGLAAGGLGCARRKFCG